MAARRTRSYRRTAPKRRLFWARTHGLQDLTTADSASTGDLLNDFQTQYGADLFGFTVTRIRGHISVQVAGQPDVSSPYNLSYGIRVDDESEITGGTDANQQDRLPANDPFADWMYIRNLWAIAPGSTSVEPSPTTQLFQNRVEIDIRSQRRLDELGQSLFQYVGVDGGVPDGFEAVNFYWDLHILCKRP